MPYDPLSLEKMRAALLEQYGPAERPIYDDGASMLGQNPDMIPVGLKVPKVFKIPEVPFNSARRTMGLDLPQNQSPVPQGFKEQLLMERAARNLPENQTSAQPPAISPIEFAAEAIKNMPMTRRQVLQTPINAAISHAGQKLMNQIDPLPAEATLTEEVAHQRAADYLSEVLDKSLEQEGMHDLEYGGLESFASSISLKELSKHSGIPIKELEKHISDQDLKEALDNAAWQTNKFLEENTLDVGYDPEEHIDRAMKEFGGEVSANDIEDILNASHDSLMNDVLESALYWGNEKPSDRITNRVLKSHASDIVNNMWSETQDDVADELNQLINDRLMGK